MPKVSVIVPVYKVEAYLNRCVESILAQTYADFELILVDDGSPDNCGVMCDAWADKDSRIHVIHQKNGGLSAARNAGIDWVFSNSDSGWLTFIDSDDWVHRDYLSVLLSACELHGVQIVMGNYAVTDVYREDELPEAIFPVVMDPEQAYVTSYSMCMSACCKIYDKTLFSQLRFPVGKLHEDAFVTHLLTFEAEKIAVCDLALYYYFQGGESITRSAWNPRKLDQIEAHELRLNYLRENGHHDAYKREIEAYVIALFTQAEQVRLACKEDGTYRNYGKELRKKLRPAFREGKENGLFPFEEQYVWIYEIAYPVKPLWVARNLINGLKRRALQN